MKKIPKDLKEVVKVINKKFGTDEVSSINSYFIRAFLFNIFWLLITVIGFKQFYFTAASMTIFRNVYFIGSCVLNLFVFFDFLSIKRTHEIGWLWGMVLLPLFFSFVIPLIFLFLNF